MTAIDPAPDATPRITLDDVKHRAEAVKNLAVSDAKSAVATVTQTDAATKVLIAVGIVVAVASVAYFLGSRAACGRADDIY